MLAPPLSSFCLPCLYRRRAWAGWGREEMASPSARKMSPGVLGAPSISVSGGRRQTLPHCSLSWASKFCFHPAPGRGDACTRVRPAAKPRRPLLLRASSLLSLASSPGADFHHLISSCSLLSLTWQPGELAAGCKLLL